MQDARDVATRACEACRYASQAEKKAGITIIHVSSVGSFGREGA